MQTLGRAGLLDGDVVSASLEQNDELCRLWQGLEGPRSDEEVHDLCRALVCCPAQERTATAP